MKEVKAKYAVLLLNMGGPESQDDVQSFLYNLFSDKDIIPFPFPPLQPLFARLLSRFRAPKVAKQYQQIGGGSPILKLTRNQAAELEKSLSSTFNCKVFIAMRYTPPFTKDSIKEILNYQPDKVILLPLYPHYSITTTGSSFNELERVISKENITIPITKIVSWFDNPDYIDTLSHLIKEKLRSYRDNSSVHLVFSAHSLPVSIIEKGDPYETQIITTVEKVIEALCLPNPYHLCYQSKVGPIKWLEPSTEETISSIASVDNQDILMIPISFVSDHYETDYEIDILYSEEAKRLGVRQFGRMESLNSHPMFIKTLSNLVTRHIDQSNS